MLHLVYGMVYNNNMENGKLQEILEKQFNGEYYTQKELEYGNKPGLFLSPFEYKELIEYKEMLSETNNEYINRLPIPAFNSKCLYFSFCNDLKSLLDTCMSISREDNSFFSRFSSNFIDSRIYSEIEGTLNVESVPTTRKRLKELLENNAPVKDKNDIIIKNMKNGIDFVNALPAFNEENLFRLYSILSKDCLEEENKLRDGEFYRYDEVEISHYYGCPHGKIKNCMKVFFEYVNKTLKSKNIYEVSLLPHICHYYMIYIHPYFDYNGRTARMVSYWIYLLSGIFSFPPIISEAINQTKNQYYRAIELSRDSHNDLTYFLKYLLNISIDYALCYQNIEYIEQTVKNKGDSLTSTELNYVKKILIAYKGIFNYSDFLKMVNVEMSKQGALKILNKFIDYGILKEVSSSSKTKLFDLNKFNFPFALKNFVN